MLDGEACSWLLLSSCCYCFARFCVFCPPTKKEIYSLRVCDRHLQDQVFGDLKQLRVISISLQQKGQNIKTAFWSFPSQLHADLMTDSMWSVKKRCFFLLVGGLIDSSSFIYLSKFNISRVPQDPTIRLFIPSVTNQLTVPHSKVTFAICPRRKYGDSWPATDQVPPPAKSQCCG